MSEHPENAGGYQWRDQEHVDGWDSRKQRMASEREPGFAALLQELPANTDLELQVLDLGAGDGTIAGIVLETYPRATAVLVDFSEGMIEKGASTMASFEGRYKYVFWDMNTTDWPAELSGPFDAVVSSAALHHLKDDRKNRLAKEVVYRLVPDGIFANYDLFREASAIFTGEHAVHNETCSTLADAQRSLVDAGCEVLVTARAPRPRHPGLELALLVGRKSRGADHGGV
jgi:SAM-dependent methyltransferase